MLAAVVGDLLGVEGDVAADVDQERRPGLVLLAPWPRSRRTTCTGPRGCSRRTGPRRRTRIAASGVAMNVLDGHSTVSPCTPAKCSAASAPAGPARDGHRGQPVPRPPRPPRSARPCRPRTSGSSRAPRRSARAAARGRDGRNRSQSARSQGRSVRRRKLKLWSYVVSAPGARVDTLLRRPAASNPARRLPIVPVGVRSGKPVRQAGRYRVSACSSSVDDQLQRRHGAPVRVAGAVEVGVVQEDHISRQHSAQRAARRSARGVVNLRQSLPQRDHSSGRRPALARRAQPGRAVDPVRRPVPGGPRADRVLDRRRAARAGRREPRPGSGAAGGDDGSRAARPRGRRRRSRPRAPAGGAPARRSRRRSRARPRARAPRAPPGCPPGAARRRRSARRRGLPGSGRAAARARARRGRSDRSEEMAEHTAR